MNKRVIIDTNVFISAFISPNSRMRKLVLTLLERTVVIFNKETFSELETRLQRPKFSRYISPEEKETLLEDIALSSVFVPNNNLHRHSYSRDPDDDKFFNLASQTNADWLISGDKDILEAPAPQSFSILSPKEAILLIASYQN